MGILSGILGDSGLVGKITDIIGKRVGDKDLATKLAADAATLVEQDQQARAMKAMEIEENFEAEITKRVQAEQASNDPYTQRTRPKIARQSWYAGCAYIFVSVASKVIAPYTHVMVIELDWGILMAIYSPALTYMGVRSFDKWKQTK